MTPSIVTSTSASFGIALIVVSEPKSAMRSTPRHGQPARRSGRREAAADVARLLLAWDRRIGSGSFGLTLLRLFTSSVRIIFFYNIGHSRHFGHIPLRSCASVPSFRTAKACYWSRQTLVFVGCCTNNGQTIAAQRTQRCANRRHHALNHDLLSGNVHLRVATMHPYLLSLIHISEPT